eukprot:TRINITY_DN22399_c2_g1_i1.p1 TRINITY_DN22399_c2_g1~~TRINITY_DN22399_c2_g1_i1.p1  ORF type:complete len:137 (+),score=12.56 TRINITY_DN22399_c2_g1_i1:145-555(+)
MKTSRVMSLLFGMRNLIYCPIAITPPLPPWPQLGEDRQEQDCTCPLPAQKGGFTTKDRHHAPLHLFATALCWDTILATENLTLLSTNGNEEAFLPAIKWLMLLNATSHVKPIRVWITYHNWCTLTMSGPITVSHII